MYALRELYAMEDGWPRWPRSVREHAAEDWHERPEASTAEPLTDPEDELTDSEDELIDPDDELFLLGEQCAEAYMQARGTSGRWSWGPGRAPPIGNAMGTSPGPSRPAPGMRSIRAEAAALDAG